MNVETKLKRAEEEIVRWRSVTCHLFDIADRALNLAGILAQTNRDNVQRELSQAPRLDRMARELQYHENWNNSSRDARLTNKKRKEFRRQLSERMAAQDRNPDKKPPRAKSRGHQTGVPGKSRPGRPAFYQSHKATICRGCGCTVLQPETPTYKRILDIDESGFGEVHYTLILKAGTCIVCGDVTFPDADHIPGTSLGPRLIEKIETFISRKCTEEDIAYFLVKLYGVTVSIGTISKCVSAMARDAYYGMRPRDEPEPYERLEARARAVREYKQERAELKSMESDQRKARKAEIRAKRCVRQKAAREDVQKEDMVAERHASPVRPPIHRVDGVNYSDTEYGRPDARVTRQSTTWYGSADCYSKHQKSSEFQTRRGTPTYCLSRARWMGVGFPKTFGVYYNTASP